MNKFCIVPISLTNLWLFFPIFIMFLLYWKAAKFEEEKLMRSPLALEYPEYQKQAGMFFPMLGL